MTNRMHELDDHAETEVLGDDMLADVPYDPNTTDVLGEEYRRQVEQIVPSTERRKDGNSPD